MSDWYWNTEDDDLIVCPYCGMTVKPSYDDTIFNRDKIIEKMEEWTKEAEKRGMTLTEYLESINPLNEANKIDVIKDISVESEEQMEIKKLTEHKGASRFGNCTECGEMESDTHRLYRLQFNGVSICLCPSCFVKTRLAMNNVVIDPYDFIGRK